ncbi:peptidylprolyl isomerase [Candidatus Woesearchaeota archaeon]|nr:peptidylprolyl isomerase [Candidatus Woesearchaeota archaeon]
MRVFKVKMGIKKGDFIEISFIARIKDSNKIFDLTDAEVAKKNNIYDEKASYDPLVICVGEGDIIAGLDAALIGKEVGKTFTIALPPENAFGKKNAKLIHLVPLSKFTEQNIMPYPGLQVNINNLFGVVKTAGGGRILVDFNHPLSGKEVTYETTIKRIVSDDAEKVKGFIRAYLQLPKVEVEVKDGAAKIELSDLPKNFKEKLTEELKKRVPSLKSVEFISKAKK